MIKFILAFLFILNPVLADGFKLHSRWTPKMVKQLTLTCQEKWVCNTVCSNPKECVVTEWMCRDCIGRGLKLSYVLEEIGRSIISTGKQKTTSDLLKKLKSKSFVTLSSKSIYNQLYRYNSLTAQKQFLGLCPEDSINQPIAFFSRSATGGIGKPEFVVCDDNVYELTNRPLIKKIVKD